MCFAYAPVPLPSDVRLRQSVELSRRMPRLTEVEGIRANLANSALATTGALADTGTSVGRRRGLYARIVSQQLGGRQRLQRQRSVEHRLQQPALVPAHARRLRLLRKLSDPCDARVKAADDACDVQREEWDDGHRVTSVHSANFKRACTHAGETRGRRRHYQDTAGKESLGGCWQPRLRFHKWNQEVVAYFFSAMNLGDIVCHWVETNVVTIVRLHARSHVLHGMADRVLFAP